MSAPSSGERSPSSASMSEGAQRRRLVELSADLVRTPQVEPSAHLDAAEKQALAWVAELLLVDGPSLERFAAIHCGSFAAHTYPRASSELVELGANLIGWLYLFDDAYGERCGDVRTLEATLRTFEELIFHGELPAAPSPFHGALADLRARISHLGGESVLQRFGYSLRLYFEGCLLEFPYRSTGRYPSLPVYRSLRRWSVGALPVFDLIELTLEQPLDSTMVQKESYCGLRDAASSLCAWTNDLYSFHKEQHAHDPHNLVAVIMRERALTAEQAFADAVQLYNSDLAAFDRALETFTCAPDTSPREVAYMRGLCDWVYGNHQWTKLSRRYQ
ncbi:MAG: terpene synthase family protein [Myxococcales bacterium]